MTGKTVLLAVAVVQFAPAIAVAVPFEMPADRMRASTSTPRRRSASDRID